MTSDFSDFMADRRRTNPESTIDNGEADVNSFASELYPEGSFFKENYNIRGDIIEKSPLLQKSLKYPIRSVMAVLPYSWRLGLAGLLGAIACTAVPTPEIREIVTPTPAVREVTPPATTEAPVLVPRTPPTIKPTPMPPTATTAPTTAPTIAPTPEAVDPIIALINSNPDLSYKLTDRTRQSMLKELKESPYREQLGPLIDQLSEAWNYKIRREDEVLCVIIPQYTPEFDCNSEEAWQFRWDNGSYHLQLWSDGNSIFPLNNDGLKEWFEKKEDTEYAIMQMWVPEGMVEYDVTQWKYSGGFQPFFTGMKNDMDVILGRKKINGLNQYKDLHDRILRVRNDSNLKSYPRPQVFASDFEEANLIFGRQFARTGGLDRVPVEYFTKMRPILLAWNDFESIRLSYGLGVLDMKDLESSDTRVNQVYQKALGYIAFEQLAGNPSGFGDHQYVAFVLPRNVIKQLPSGVLIYRGQSVSAYSMEGELKIDKVRYVRAPNGTEIVWKP